MRGSKPLHQYVVCSSNEHHSFISKDNVNVIARCMLHNCEIISFALIQYHMCDYYYLLSYVLSHTSHIFVCVCAVCCVWRDWRMAAWIIYRQGRRYPHPHAHEYLVFISNFYFSNSFIVFNFSFMRDKQKCNERIKRSFSVNLSVERCRSTKTKRIMVLFIHSLKSSFYVFLFWSIPPRALCFYVRHATNFNDTMTWYFAQFGYIYIHFHFLCSNNNSFPYSSLTPFMVHIDLI